MNESNESPLTKKLSAHPVHETLAEWRNRIVSERPENLRDLSDEARFAYLRLRFVFRHLRNKLETMNPFLLNYAGLNNIKNQIDKIKPNWEQFRQNPEQHWNQLDNHVDGLASHLQSLPVVTDSGWTDEFDDLIEEMHGEIARSGKTVDGLMAKGDQADAKFEQVRQNLEAFENEIQSQKQRLDEMLNQHSSTFTKSEEDRAARFTKSQDEKKDEYDSLVGRWEESVDSLLSDQQKKCDQFEEEERQKAKGLVEEIQGRLDEAIKIVGTIVNTTMSGTYELVANREYKNAWTMRWIAMVSFGVMGVMIVWAVAALHIDENGIDWRTLGLRISLGIAFVIPGIYCAKEANRHWNAEKQNRRLAMELATLHPFLDKLDEDKRKSVIHDMAKEYFGGSQGTDTLDESITVRDVNAIGNQMISFAREIVKILKK